MSIKFNKQTTGTDQMEPRIIRVDNLPDQAGIAAALRRAFMDRPGRSLRDERDPFAALLKQIH